AQGIQPDDELLSFLGGETEQLALIHVKLHVANATAAPSDPGEYRESLEWLRKQGYRLVLVGREPMPEAFEPFDLLNYAESPIATYARDLQLFSRASLAVTAGSGAALIPDCMGVPLLYLDSWHLQMPLFSPRCVMVPALVRERESGEFLCLRDQLNLYKSLADHGDETFPIDRWEPRNASSDEILAGLKELLSLVVQPSPLDELQQEYRRLDPDGLLPLSQSRASRYFLEKHRELLRRHVGGS
ncbi:MAG: TIGR04372 family glycosyltransferase, partial [Myxococcota bacterium]